jgi:hypothetical protein
MSNEQELDNLVLSIEDHFIKEIKDHGYFTKLNCNDKAAWATEYLKPGELYTYDKLHLALDGLDRGWLYRYDDGGNGTPIELDACLLYLGVECSAATRYENRLIFYYNDTKWKINPLSAIHFKKIKTTKEIV